MASDAQPREGGRFKAKPPPAPTRIPTPAHDRFAEMEAKRCSNPDRFVVVPPVPLNELNRIGQVRHGEAIDHNRRELTSLQLTAHLHSWLEATAKEGTPGDLERAWIAFDPPVTAVKIQHRNIFDRLLPECLRRMGELGLVWEKEKQALRAAEAHRRAIEAARAEIEEAEQQLAVDVPAELAKRRAHLAELEAAI